MNAMQTPASPISLRKRPLPPRPTSRVSGTRPSGASCSSTRSPAAKLQGIFQDYYHVDGVVSGKNIYLALIDDEWTEYTVQLHRDNYDTITGYWSAHIPFSEEDQQPLTLKRIEK